MKRTSKELDRLIKKEIVDPDGDYSRLYGIDPIFAQYVWGYEWTKKLLRDYSGGDARKLVSRCSKDFLADALSFELQLQ